MPWFKVDDGFHGHPKVIGLSASAVGLWLLAGTWAAQYLTDGKVPSGMVPRFGGSADDATALVGAGLWHEADGGYSFHEWAKYQPTKEDVEAEREAARERMRSVRAKRKGTVANTDEGSAEVRANTDEGSEEVRLTPTQPDPAQPSPSQPEPSDEGSVGARKRASRIPDPFVLTGDMRSWAEREVPGLDANDSTQRFVDYWRAESGAKARKLDWVAAWRNWLRRDADRTTGQQPKTFGQQKQDNTLALVQRYREEEQREEVGDGNAHRIQALGPGR